MKTNSTLINSNMKQLMWTNITWLIW